VSLGAEFRGFKNLDVGVSTLATIQIKVSNQEVASGRVDSLSNIGADVQYFGPLFA